MTCYRIPKINTKKALIKQLKSMNKIFKLAMLLICILITACSSDNEPKEPNTATPIQFGKREYTVMFGKGIAIPFTGGGGVYELTASNPDVLGKFGIDMETNNHLYIQPSKIGESYLTIKDVKADATVTLHIIVEDFYLAFVIDEIEGNNKNPFFVEGATIKYIRNEDNTKPVKIEISRPVTFQIETIAEGVFDITQSDTYIFTMKFTLHHKSDEEYVLYEYTMGGDGMYMSLFNSIFNFGWKEIVASSKSQPVKVVEMILTDKNNDCKIRCHLAS